MDYNNYPTSYDDPTPPHHLRLEQIYKVLISLLEAVSPDIVVRSLNDGSGERFNGYIDELIALTSDSTLKDFKVQIRTHTNGSGFVKGEAYARQMHALSSYLHSTNATIGYYCMPPPDVRAGSGTHTPAATVNNHLQSQQTSSQSTSVHVEINQQIVSITEALTNFERDHPDEASKENKYAKALKKALPTVKTSMDIVSLVLKVAGQVGIDPHTALKAIGLN